eukprot:3631554-Alexandrium_andersonii.AAC.1
MLIPSAERTQGVAIAQFKARAPCVLLVCMSCLPSGNRCKHCACVIHLLIIESSLCRSCGTLSLWTRLRQ